jgi:hypothetical protein
MGAMPTPQLNASVEPGQHAQPLMRDDDVIDGLQETFARLLLLADPLLAGSTAGVR